VIDYDDMINSSGFNVEEGKSPLKLLRELIGNMEGHGAPISQQELAQRLGVGIATVSRWERGITPAMFTIPQLKNLKKLLDSVGLSIEELPDDLGPYKNAGA
jgi:DNA-binding XRE family transcriptional regulator